MQSYRTVSRLPFTRAQRVLKPTTTRKMSFFPRSFINNDPTTSFTPLFRLLDDFDQYARNTEAGGRHHRFNMKTFNPKFDVKEVADAYELHGELPGIERQNVEIEFTDSQTITIKGRSEHSYTSGTPPAGFVEGPAATSAITEGDETNSHHKGHRATVEEEGSEATTTEVAKNDEHKEAEKTESDAKFWVSERYVGEFSRSFSFPVRVDQDQVKASMENGILSIVVPKIKKQEGRKITIS